MNELFLEQKTENESSLNPPTEIRTKNWIIPAEEIIGNDMLPFL